MDLQCCLNAKLPRLAWCARVQGEQTYVAHGQDVELNKDSFVEGAWAGRFDMFGFAESEVFLGSGGTATQNSILFATSTHTLDRLYTIQLKTEWIIANSMALALVVANEELDTYYAGHVYDLVSFMHYGIDHPNPSLPTRSGKRIRICCHCNIHVGPNLSIKYSPKATPPIPNTYEEYYEYLAETTNALAVNAADPHRTRRYRPVSTVSAGYDSPACAAIARDHAGCTEALTFVQARTEYSHGTNDSGEPIATLLGMKLEKFNRSDYLKHSGMPSAEFLACGGLDDVVMNVMEQALSGTLMFTGEHGDVVWSLDQRKISSTIKRTELAGVTMGEFRLRVGFIRYPLPFNGCIHHQSIHGIAQSESMRPWSVPGSYNRPLPRRIAEDAGIPRELFGQQKMAATVVQFAKYSDLKRAMTRESIVDYELYKRSLRGRLWRDLGIDLRIRSNTLGSNFWARTLNQLSKSRQTLIESTINKPLVWRVANKLRQDRYQITVPIVYPLAYHMGRPPGDTMFLWGLQTVMQRYAKSMRGDITALNRQQPCAALRR